MEEFELLSKLIIIHPDNRISLETALTLSYFDSVREKIELSHPIPIKEPFKNPTEISLIPWIVSAEWIYSSTKYMKCPKSVFFLSTQILKFTDDDYEKYKEASIRISQLYLSTNKLNLICDKHLKELMYKLSDRLYIPTAWDMLLNIPYLGIDYKYLFKYLVFCEILFPDNSYSANISLSISLFKRKYIPMAWREEITIRSNYLRTDEFKAILLGNQIFYYHHTSE